MNCTTSEMLSALLMVWVECVLFQKKKNPELHQGTI